MTTQDSQNIQILTSAIAPGAPTLQLIDANTANVSYYGTAPSATLTSAAAWTITQVIMNATITTSGSALVITPGAGNETITSQPLSGQIWDNRASLTYKY